MSKGILGAAIAIAMLYTQAVAAAAPAEASKAQFKNAPASITIARKDSNESDGQSEGMEERRAHHKHYHHRHHHHHHHNKHHNKHHRHDHKRHYRNDGRDYGQRDYEARSRLNRKSSYHTPNHMSKEDMHMEHYINEMGPEHR